MGCRISFSLVPFGFFLVSLLLGEVEPCGRDWMIYNDFCYGFFKEPKTWSKAEVDCHSMGAHLASIHSSEVTDRLAKYISSYSQSNKNVWIGIHLPTGSNRWTWSDHSKFDYIAWKTGEPNNFSLFGKEECGQLVSELEFLRWNDAVCSNKRPYLCMIPHVSSCLNCG